MSVAVTVSFLESAFLLDKKTRKSIMDAISQLESNQEIFALRCHRIDKMKCDPTFWSARVTDDIRIIFSMEGERKTLLYVDHHDAAYDWCEGKYLRKTCFGATMLYDESLIAAAQEKLDAAVSFAPAEKSLLEKQGLKKKQLLKIGITEIHADNLMKIADEDQYLDYIQIYPQELQEALLSLETGDKSFDEVYIDLTDEEFQKGKTTEHKDTKRRIHLLQDLKELKQILEEDDFEQWTVFLHPEQEKLVKMNFNGPALIEGGPGTGKTVIGMHRAVHLATNVFPNGRVLICTFSKKLASCIQEKMEWLEISKAVECLNIDVLGIDSFILSLYKQAYGKSIEIASSSDIRKLIRELYRDHKPKSGSVDFYLYEYAEVIERNQVRSLEAYLACDRSGSGGPPLTARQREVAWPFIDMILREKQARSMLSFVDVAHEVANAYRANKLNKPYDAIIIDEAQDLEPIKLEVLSLSTKSETNNLYILSDVNQRVFRLNSWKKDSKINIVGRTYYLSVNYRTTKQISDYARNQFENSEIITAHIRDYKSIMNGEPPIVMGFPDLKSEQLFIIDEIRKLTQVYPAEQICIVCPTRNDCTGLSSILQFSDIKNLVLFGDLLPQKGKGVNICTIRGVKGLEFRIIFLTNYTDIVRHCLEEAGQLDIIKDSFLKMADCEKYVATTRARDLLYITYVDEEDDDA